MTLICIYIIYHVIKDMFTLQANVAKKILFAHT